MCKLRIWAAAIVLTGLGASTAQAWWLHHHHQRPVMVGRPVVGGEFFYGGTEFFMPSVRTEFFVPTVRSEFARTEFGRSEFGRSEFAREFARVLAAEMGSGKSNGAEGRTSGGAAPPAPAGAAAAPTASCAHLEKRLDQLTVRVDALTEKLGKVESMLIQKQVEREKVEFMEAVSKSLEQHLKAHSQSLLPVLSELSKAEKDRNPDALKAMIEKLRR